MCLESRGQVAIRLYGTGLGYATPTVKDNDNLHDKQWELTDDGRLSCRFSRDMKVYTDSVDLNNNWYQLYTWGDVSQCQSIHIIAQLVMLSHFYVHRFFSLVFLFSSHQFLSLIHI